MTQLTAPLNKVQIEILKLFNQPMNDKDLAELNYLLSYNDFAGLIA